MAKSPAIHLHQHRYNEARFGGFQDYSKKTKEPLSTAKS
jgi:hypothetical protein